MFLELLFLHLIASGICLFGGILMWRHHVAWVRARDQVDIESGELRFYRSQYRRRMQASGMITFLGGLLHFSNEYLVPWQKAPLSFSLYVAVMFIMVSWIVVLALGDWAATRTIHSAALAKLEEQRRHLERDMQSMRRESTHRGTVVESTGVIRRN